MSSARSARKPCYLQRLLLRCCGQAERKTYSSPANAPDTSSLPPPRPRSSLLAHIAPARVEAGFAIRSRMSGQGNNVMISELGDYPFCSSSTARSSRTIAAHRGRGELRRRGVSLHYWAARADWSRAIWCGVARRRRDYCGRPASMSTSSSRRRCFANSRSWPACMLR